MVTKKKQKNKGSEGECTAKAVADSAHHMGLDPQNKEQMKVSHSLLALITELTKQLQQAFIEGFGDSPVCTNMREPCFIVLFSN